MARRVFTALVVLAVLAGPASAADQGCDAKLDAVLRERAHHPAGSSQVLVRTSDAHGASAAIRAAGGLPGRRFGEPGLQLARIPDDALHHLAAFPHIVTVSLDRPVEGTLDRTAAAVGARWVRDELGFDGQGVGVALIDSGVTPLHDDLDSARVVHFVDFVNFRTSHYDDYGHGTHVAGIIAGNGSNSGGIRVGIAPGSSLIVLKALDGAGFGYTSNVIAALDYAVANREKYNIRVINLSVAAGVYESYKRDPLTLAAKRAVDAGIVVVAAAGNLGRNSLGKPQYGGIAAPGNAPWVLTIGASTHKGTSDRADDEVAGFSSRGPSAIDRSAKPDLIAPGVGIESITEPSSVLFGAHPNARLWGTMRTVSPPYLSLSGTSMASPVVAGTIALMLQANPALTPNAIKAILQFTAENRAGFDQRTQGAGFLNARGAVALARAFGRAGESVRVADAGAGDPVPWSRRLIWGSRVLSGGTITPGANAWQRGLVWGAAATPAGDPVVWGTLCAPDDLDCTGSPWTSGCVQGTPGCTAARLAAAGVSSPLDEGCDDPGCAADVWLAAMGAGPSDLVIAGSVDDVPARLPAVRNGWPEELGDWMEAAGSARAGAPRRHR